MELFAFDDDYVRRLREGDRETEEHYVRYFKLPLTLMLRRRGVPSDEREDIIQITHLRVINELRYGKGIRDGHAFGGWVHAICTHVAQELERKRRETVEVPEELASKDEGALRQLLTKETEARVRRALQSLATKEKRDADILRELFFQDRPKDEICRRHGVDRGYLRVLVHRALKKFRDEYDHPDDS
ncbi:MAG TPA: sigma-70 family RNA polymerase sigma factor [Thermoanaerobaculia bacterium]|nr:sigma-70 family RNA polymerase sigma factor [Thermoanaerobaculia bacterium]